MLDLGFGVGAHGGENGGTALHAAAYAGSADAVRLLLDRGADVDARDETWDSHPLVWAAIGSSEQRDLNPRPDWAATVQALLEAGANAADVTLSPDEDHQPSPEVATLLRKHATDDYRPLSIGLSLMSSSSCSRWVARLVVAIRQAKWRTPAAAYWRSRAATCSGGPAVTAWMVSS